MMPTTLSSSHRDSSEEPQGEKEESEEWAKGAGRFITADHPSLILQGLEETTVVQVEFPPAR